MMNKKMLFKLFITNLYLSAFTFGGGYVIVTLMKNKYVDELNWIEEKEMLNLAAIAQSAPGAVAVNAAILVGYRTAGIIGTIIAVFGTIIPPFVIISLISLCYTAFRENIIVAAVLKGMQSGIAAVIADVTVNLCSSVYKESGILSVLVMAAAFCASWFFGVNVLWIILACAIYGILRTFFTLSKKKGDLDK